MRAGDTIKGITVGAVLLVIHLFICVALILAVLLQAGKGGGLAGAFGGAEGPGAVFGGRGAATFLSKMTTVLAIAFVLSCLIQVKMPGRRGGPRLETASERQADTREALPTGVPGVPMEVPTESSEQTP